MATLAKPTAAQGRLSDPATLVPLLLLALVATVAFTALGSFGTVQESAKAELDLSDDALALIQGLGAAVPMVLFSVPVGILVDRRNRVRLTMGLAVLWTLGTLLTAFAPSAGWLTAARMLVGIGSTGSLTAALSLCADFCAPAQRGKAMLIVNLGKALGVALGFALTGWLFGLLSDHAAPGWLADVAPWRSTHVLLAMISAMLIVPLLLLREPIRREVEASTNAPFRVVAAELWSRRAFLIPLFAGQIAVVMADVAAGVWVAPVLSRDFGLSPQEFAGWVGALMFGTGVAGAVLGGISADLGQKSKLRGGIILGAVIAAGLGIPAALFPLMPSITGFAIALGVLSLCGAVTGLVVSVALTVLLPNELRGLCIGAFIAVAGLIGFGLAPWIVTRVSAFMGGETMLAEALAIVGVSVSTLSFLAFIMAMRRVPEPVR
ncbi:MAG TPA: MFS transporter [Erythrobacter sp.]|jgi:MFS family permease|nr:MFS transporter [Erythrobacter sp. A30-3]HAG37242.1 MFS transporter [Erythrobacter sp.]|tara:strand:- start:1955 stop:3259 length:1305 start_codon:yes stop_codon:yes gene_type:complete